MHVVFFLISSARFVRIYPKRNAVAGTAERFQTSTSIIRRYIASILTASLCKQLKI
jgi:hypothetical protein